MLNSISHLKVVQVTYFHLNSTFLPFASNIHFKTNGLMMLFYFVCTLECIFLDHKVIVVVVIVQYVYGGLSMAIKLTKFHHSFLYIKIALRNRSIT